MISTARIVLFLLLLGLCACAPNAAQLDRMCRQAEKDIVDLRSLQAEHTAELSQIRQDLRLLTGQIEELQYLSRGKTQELERTIHQLGTRVPPPPGVPDDLLTDDEEKIGKITGEAADQYRRALGLLRGADFERARDIFNEFCEANPDTAFSDNAHFWIGITDMRLGYYDRAIVAFSEVFQEYPAEDRVAPSLYYLAEAFAKIDSPSDARVTLQKLIEEHSRSPYAAKAKKLLSSLSTSSKRPTRR